MCLMLSTVCLIRRPDAVCHLPFDFPPTCLVVITCVTSTADSANKFVDRPPKNTKMSSPAAVWAHDTSIRHDSVGSHQPHIRGHRTMTKQQSNQDIRTRHTRPPPLISRPWTTATHHRAQCCQPPHHTLLHNQTPRIQPGTLKTSIYVQLLCERPSLGWLHVGQQMVWQDTIARPLRALWLIWNSWWCPAMQ